METGHLRIREVFATEECLEGEDSILNKIGKLRYLVWEEEGAINAEAFPSKLFLDDLDRQTEFVRHWVVELNRTSDEYGNEGDLVAAARLTMHLSLDDDYRDVALWKKAGKHLPLPTCDMGRLVVRKDWQRKGLAQELNALRIEAAKKWGAASIMVTASEGNARLLQKKNGFEDIGERVEFSDRPGVLFLALQLNLEPQEPVVVLETTRPSLRELLLPSNLYQMDSDPIVPKFATLLVASRLDTASVNIFEHLMFKNSLWREIVDKQLWVSRGNRNTLVYLYMQDRSLLILNDIQNEVEDRFLSPKIRINSVVFLSKHCAKSGIPALTIHPVGLPMKGSGGICGRCSPPSLLIGPLFRRLRAEVEKRQLQGFQVSLEASHHGPYCSVPCCFVEIGSSEAQWGIPECGSVWADVLTSQLGMREVVVGDEWANEVPASVELGEDKAATAKRVATNLVEGEQQEEEEEEEEGDAAGASTPLVLVVVGGGHYVPKMNDAAIMGILPGHAIATYSLANLFQSKKCNDAASASVSVASAASIAAASIAAASIRDPLDQISSDGRKEKGERGGEGGGNEGKVAEQEKENEEDEEENVREESLIESSQSVASALREALESTALAHPNSPLVCFVDKKSFNTDQRIEITTFLDQQGISWTLDFKTIKKQWKEKSYVMRR